VLVKQQEPRVTTIRQQKKQRSRQRQKPTTNDKIQLVLDLIKSEIFMLPRPGKNRADGALNQSAVKSSESYATSEKYEQPTEKLFPEPCTTCSVLIEKLEAYEHAIAEIESISIAASAHFNGVNFGRVSRDDWVWEEGVKMVEEHYQKSKKFPTMEELHKSFYERLFYKDPDRYTKKVGQNMQISVFREKAFNPQWSYWNNQQKPVTKRWLSHLLTELKRRHRFTGSLS
jgi:hypothetical protein